MADTARQRDADAGVRDIPLPSAAQDDMDGGSPCPEDGDFFDARPDAAETEGVWNRSQNCAGASCVPDVIHLICQNTAFME